MVTLTDAAVNTLELAVTGEVRRRRGRLRIAVADGGCAGHKYQMGLEATAGDDVLTFGPVTIFVDPTSQPFLTGVVVDFVEGVEGAGFKFDNPNATGSCGCGKSFSAGPGGSCSSAPAPGGCGTAH
uniref:Uncharacterized protein in nifU 5'region n=1 Tax=Azospirillum brasilense TaxID=192 RepID=YNIU_AZOBR|nr:RecName: Full=Uncharacterized protein in nifU 5'region; AltName: Full=ORF2 [Azospirillum brasilense]AAC46175.1 ATP-binding protein [Azospirillum brasilense]